MLFPSETFVSLSTLLNSLLNLTSLSENHQSIDLLKNMQLPEIMQNGVQKHRFVLENDKQICSKKISLCTTGKTSMYKTIPNSSVSALHALDQFRRPRRNEQTWSLAPKHFAFTCKVQKAPKSTRFPDVPYPEFCAKKNITNTKKRPLGHVSAERSTIHGRHFRESTSVASGLFDKVLVMKIASC